MSAYHPFNVMNCWLGGRQSSPKSYCYLWVFLTSAPLLTFCCGRTNLHSQWVHWHLPPAPYSTAFESMPDFEISILESLPGLCCYNWQPQASSFSWKGWGRCPRENVHWMNGWDLPPFSSAMQLLVLLTPVDQELHAERQRSQACINCTLSPTNYASLRT